MNAICRSVAGVAALGILSGITFPANANLAITRFGAKRPVGASAPQLFGRVQVADVPRSIFPARDFGRRQPLAPVTASIMLRYNRQAELEALVAAQGNRRSPLYHHFLTTAQFKNYFAPTPQQQAYVIANLQAAGLRVTRTFSNRTLLDVVGTSAAAERFFNTEIHSISQDRYGARFANVRPATIPANLAPLIRSVSLSNLITARAEPHHVSAAGLAVMRASLPRGRRAPAFTSLIMPASESPNFAANATSAVKDAGFESGKLGHGWSHCDGPHAYPTAEITNSKAHTGKHSGFAGSSKTSEPEQNGYTGICQLVAIPKNGILSAYLYQLTSEKNTTVAGQDVALLDTSGKVVTTLASTVNDHAGWVSKTWSVAAYAGRNLYIYFGVHGDGDRHNYTQQYVDDVSLTGSGPAPTPTPTAKPTAKPTATPTSKPTATPTVGPTATPTGGPTATPTVGPTATPTGGPTATPTAGPTATPTAGPTATPTALPTALPTMLPTSTPTAAPVGCGDTPDSGPLSNEYGYLAAGVADGFDYPVQHGCSGTGQTVATVNDSPVYLSDVAAYLHAAGVTQTGTITNVPVDGGAPTFNDNPETALDVETIAGLSPGANIRIYDIPDDSDGSIVDGFNAVVSENLASAVNAPFTDCESGDTAFADQTEAIAVQGAALGITFVARSGNYGSDECATENNPPGVSTPAGDPHFVSVGGDNFTESPTGKLLTLTAEGDDDNSFHSGGGVSSYFALPSYQQGIPHIIYSGRNQPDVSLPGVDIALYFNSGSVGAQDDTAWASSCFVALLAEAIELNGGARYGFVNPDIYSISGPTSYGAFFTDVTVGTNVIYQATTGYDRVTGLGAPIGYAFSKAI